MMNNQYSGTDVGEVKVFIEKDGTALNVNEFYGIEVCLSTLTQTQTPTPTPTRCASRST